jgi:hypothetical protein
MDALIFFSSLGALVILIWLLSLISTAIGNSKRKWWFNQPDPTERFTGWLVAWTALLFCATIANVIVINHTDDKIGEQAKIANRQLAVMEIDQRPWVSMVSLPEIIEPLRLFDKNWAEIGLKIKIKNSGKSPARHVTVSLKLVGFPRSSNLLAEQERFCPKEEKPREPLRKGAVYSGFTIFPGDQYEIPEWADALNEDMKEMRAANAQGRAIVSGIVGCISYQFLSDDVFHRTGIILDLHRKVPNQETNYAINLDAGPMQPNDLTLSLNMFGNGPAY